jgi:hypothetical protein
MIFVYISLILSAALFTWGLLCFKYKRYKESFASTMADAKLPIIAVTHGTEMFYFVLDSGASDNHITPMAAARMEGNMQKINYLAQGLGTSQLNQQIKCIIKNLNGDKFNATFLVNADLAKSLAQSPVRIDGLIGNSFMRKYKLILDFENNQVIYPNR